VFLEQSSPTLIDEEEPLIEFSDDDDDDDDDAIKEFQQIESEVSTRIFHLTMNQKAGKNRKDPRHKSLPSSFAARLDLPDPLPVSQVKSQALNLDLDMQELIVQSFKKIMNTVRGYRGHINVQVTFGRILLANVPYQHIDRMTAEFEGYMFPEDLKKLLDQQVTETHFTRVLTCNASDIHFLLDVQTNVDNKRMWSKHPISREVLYEFQFATGDNRFIVQMNADSLKYEIKTPRDLGSIFVHGIKRRWDLSIQVQGNTKYQENDNNEAEYHEIAQCISDTMFVP
jgi:hypothetical protein